MHPAFATARRLVLVVLFTAGAWEDLLIPGAHACLVREAPGLGTDEDAEDGYVLNDAPPEAQLHLEPSFGAFLTSPVRHAPPLAATAESPPFARPVFHVPLAPGSPAPMPA
jgi:hypothetical protein